MSHPNDQHLSLKDKITSHLPGHKNQDNNANGVPDRLEKNSAATHGAQTGYPMAGNGATIIPGSTQTTTTTSVTKDVNGLPIQGNVLKDRTTTSTTVAREPAMVQATGFVGGANDLNRNGIPDNLERGQTTYVQTTQTGYTDLNRNGIPDQLERGNSFGFVGSVQANQTSVVDVREAPTIVERVEKAAVVHEVYKTEEVVQIQPIINREREQLDVYEVVQPMREREVIATEVREATLAAQTRATIVEDNSAFLAQRSVPGEFSTREVAATMSQTVTNAPIIHETITHRVIEEVQPVIYKEIDRPVLIRETQPIYEKIVEAPRVHHTVLPMNDMGVRTVTTTTTTTGFTDINRDGIPDQLQGGMYQTTGLQSGLQSQGVYGAQTGYTTTTVGGMNDLNRNGIPDSMERRGVVGGMNDLNRNGIPDNLERQGQYGQTGYTSTVGGMNDLNRNGIPDSMERQQYGQTGYNTGLAGGLNDRNGNGIPDNMEGRSGQRSLHDLNGNGIPDRMEKGHGLKDLNGNGIDDSLERRMGTTSLNQNTRL